MVLKKAPFDQLDIDDLQDIGKYMFSLANGNHIQRYTEVEYRDYLSKMPTAICKMLMVYHGSMNWGEDDPRMYMDYDEQWLASEVDPDFSSSLDFNLDDFRIDNLKPYQKAVVGFTYILIALVEDWELWLQSGSALEKVYSTYANNLHIDKETQEILNIEHANNRGVEMFRCVQDEDFKPKIPFADWELVIY